MRTTENEQEIRLLKTIYDKTGLVAAVEGRDVLVRAGQRAPILISIQTPALDLPFVLMPFDKNLQSSGIQFQTTYGGFPSELGVLVFGDEIPQWAISAFEQRGIGYVDFSGACFVPLRVAAHRKSSHLETKIQGSHRLRGRGQREQLIFALISQPDLRRQTKRAIAREIGLPHSTVNHALHVLADEGYLKLDADLIANLNTRKLVDYWLEFYKKNVHTLTRPERFRFVSEQPQSTHWWRTLAIDGMYWGGDVAAERLNLDLKLRPAHFLLYYEPAFRSEILSRLRLVPDQNGSVELRKRFWNFSWPEKTSATIVPPLLVYSDLILTHDARAIEAANYILRATEHENRHRR